MLKVFHFERIMRVRRKLNYNFNDLPPVLVPDLFRAGDLHISTDSPLAVPGISVALLERNLANRNTFPSSFSRFNWHGLHQHTVSAISFISSENSSFSVAAIEYGKISHKIPRAFHRRKKIELCKCFSFSHRLEFKIKI